MKSLILKRSIILTGHRMSITLEDAFWRSLKEIASRREMTLSGLIVAIKAKHHGSNLLSALLFVINFYRDELDIRYRREAAQDNDYAL